MYRCIEFVLLLSLVCLAETYHVSPDGPVQSILAAVQVAGPGDTVLVADGVYGEEEVKIEDKLGSDSNRLVLRAANPMGAKIFSRTQWHVISIWRSTGVTVEGFELTYDTAQTEGTWAGVYATECEWVSIRDNFVHDCGLSGIQVDKSDNMLVEGNRCVSNSYRNELNGSGISFYHPVARSESPSGFGIIIRGNICTRNWCEFSFPGYDVPTDGNGIILDDYYNTQGGGQEGGYPKATLVENNICYNNGGRGIHTFLSDNVVVRNNTLWHNNYLLQEYHTYVGDLSFTSSNNSTASNNIVVFRPENRPGHACWVEGNGIVLTNNIFVGSVQFQNSDASLDGGGSGSNQVGTDQGYPEFLNASIDTATNDFRLIEGSPAIDAGTSAQCATHDIQGWPRPVGSEVDIGAYEYDATPSRHAFTLRYESSGHGFVSFTWYRLNGSTASKGMLSVPGLFVGRPTTGSTATAAATKLTEPLHCTVRVQCHAGGNM